MRDVKHASNSAIAITGNGDDVTASRVYAVTWRGPDNKCCGFVLEFHEGEMPNGSVNGITEDVLLAILIDRLRMVEVLHKQDALHYLVLARNVMRGITAAEPSDPVSLADTLRLQVTRLVVEAQDKEIVRLQTVLAQRDREFIRLHATVDALTEQVHLRDRDIAGLENRMRATK